MKNTVVTIKDKEEDAEAPPVMKLWLDDQQGGTIHLRAEDDKGHNWHLASIDFRGIQMLGSIPSTTGWPLTTHGRLKTVGR